ncbi:MAG: permease [Planctomycetota bacterium]
MRLRDSLLAAYVVVAALGLTGVLFRDVVTREGLVLGLPIGLAWVTGWAVVTFAVMTLYHVTRPERGDDSEGAR